MPGAPLKLYQLYPGLLLIQAKIVFLLWARLELKEERYFLCEANKRVVAGVGSLLH